MESADPWLERLIEEQWWRISPYERPRRTRDWKGAEDLAPHLEANPDLASLITGGYEVVMRWAKVPEPEVDVYMMRAQGYTVAAIAHHYGLLETTVEQRIFNAHSRIHAELTSAQLEVAI